jgi:diamine N-acetyltransferase
MENPSSTDRRIQLKPLTRFNWEQATRLQLHDYQVDFLPSVMFSLAQSKFENLFPYGIFEGDDLVGFAMYGEFDQVCWISRFMLDKAHQEKGIGRLALLQLLDLLRKSPRCKEIRTSFARQNALAEYFFRSVGFEPMGEGVDREIVMRWAKR